MYVSQTHSRSDTSDTSDADDGALIAAAQANIAAFDALYARYLDRVFRYARAHVGSNEEAADTTQQVFLKALQALPRYHERGVPFAVWLFRIARHTIIDAARRQRPTVPWETLAATRQPTGADTPEAAAMQREELLQLRRFIAALSPRQRELLALKFAGALSASEIAAVIGSTPGAVRKQLSRTIHSLKEHYDVADVS